MEATDAYNWSKTGPLLKEKSESWVIIRTLEDRATVELHTEVAGDVQVSTLFSASEGDDLYYAIMAVERGNKRDFESIKELKKYLAKSF